MNNEIEIPFGAFDSELMHQEISIPEGFTATIEGNKIILTRTESEDEKVRKEIIKYLEQNVPHHHRDEVLKSKEWIAWLEKQATPQMVEDAFLKGCNDTKKSFLKKQGEQKSVKWSEKDDIMIKETLYFLREYQQSNRCKDENGMQNSVTCEKWLKSLKQRIGE